MKYSEHVPPKQKGKDFREFKVPRKYHNQIFTKYLKAHWTDTFLYWVDISSKDHSIIIERYNNLLVKICMILIVPYCILMVDIPQTMKDLKRQLFQRKFQSYFSQTVTNLMRDAHFDLMGFAIEQSVVHGDLDE